MPRPRGAYCTGPGQGSFTASGRWRAVMADRALRDLCQDAGAVIHDDPTDDVPVHVVRAREPCRDDSPVGHRAPSSAPYLALALSSRRAAGLADEIADGEPWRVFGRAISQGGSPLVPPRTSGADKCSGLRVVPHLTVAPVVPAVTPEAPPTNEPQDHRPT
jgi:hypothetical protein